MSDVVRNYTGQAGSLRSRPRRFRRRGLFTRVVLPCLLFLLAVLWWMTRDTYHLAECIPAGQRLTAIVDDPLTARDRVFQSRVWRAIPDNWATMTNSDLARSNFGIPQWVLNNLFYDRAIVSGNEVGTNTDLVLLSRMTHIGTLLERFHGFSASVEDDYAGGLELRAIPDRGVYYAVRGRILLISASRDALIRALTLAEGDQLGQSQFDELARSGGEDIRGTVVLAPDHALGRFFESVAFALRVDADSAHAKCRGVLRPEAAADLRLLLADANPVSLRTPPEGMIAVSADFGKPVKEVWSAVGEATGATLFSAGQWESWANGAPDQSTGVASFLTSLAGDKGPGIRIAMTGIDANEIVPMPILVGTFDGDAGAVKQTLESIPAPPEEIQPWDSYPRYDAETGLAYVPMFGGPSLEPAIAVSRNMMFVGSSRESMRGIMSNDALSQDLPQAGNLFIQIRPGPLAKSIVESGRLLAEIDVLRGFTQESFEAAAASWMTSAENVDTITALAAVHGDAIEFEFRVVCPASAAGQN